MKLQYKTNINCGSCIRSVTGFINEVEGLEQWSVDTENPDKILTVEGANLNAKAVEEAMEEAGFDLQPIASVA